VQPTTEHKLNVHRLDCPNIEDGRAINKTLLEAGLDADAGVDPELIAVIWDKERAIENKLREMKRNGAWAEND
jgi:hypothetical protein